MHGNFDAICRVCLDTDTAGLLVPIFGKHHKDTQENVEMLPVNYSKLIAVFGRVKIHQDDGLPQNVCRRCVTLLKSAIKLRLLCRRTQRVLTKSLARNTVIPDGERSAIEIALFQKYFPGCDRRNNGAVTIDKFRNGLLSSDTSGMFASGNKIPSNFHTMLDSKRDLDRLKGELEDDINDALSKGTVLKESREGSDSPFVTFAGDQLTFEDSNHSPDNSPEKPAKRRRRTLDDDALLTLMENLIKKKTKRRKGSRLIRTDGRVKCSRERLNADKLLAMMENLVGKKVKQHSEDEMSSGDDDRMMSTRALRRRQKRFGEEDMSLLHKVIATSKWKNRPKGQVQCNVCKKTLKHYGSLRIHMQLHNGYRIICEQCGKGFSNRAALNYHSMTRHGAVRPYACGKCSFRAARPYDLREHERTHTGERPFVCDHCGMSFGKRICLKAHMAHHAEVKPFKCDWCPSSFFHQSDLMAHVNNKHDRKYKYQCHLCDIVYTKTETVRRHLTQHHSVPRKEQGRIRRISVK